MNQVVTYRKEKYAWCDRLECIDSELSFTHRAAYGSGDEGSCDISTDS